LPEDSTPNLVETITLPSGKLSSLFGEVERKEKILRRLLVAGLMGRWEE
jgi:hypothetical protein